MQAEIFVLSIAEFQYLDILTSRIYSINIVEWMRIGMVPITIQSTKYEIDPFPYTHINSGIFFFFSFQFCRQKMASHYCFLLSSLFPPEVLIASNHAYLGKNTLYRVRNLEPNFGWMSQNLKVLTKQTLVGGLCV